ncbi:MAG: hypothetical protein JWM19_2503 [Actinomycetia bacterium]|nr:hypothetical protein [Actinomycetes bacterium]
MAQAPPGVEFTGGVDDGRAAATAARQRITDGDSRLAQAQAALTAAVDKLRRTSGNFPRISGPVKDRVMHHPPDVLGRNATGLAAQLRLRASTLEGELAAIAKDQGILADSLAGVVRDSMETLAKAERSSRMGTAPGAWADRKVLRIGFERPDDAILHAYAERVIERVIQKGLKPEGMPLLKEAVREAAGTQGFTVRVLNLVRLQRDVAASHGVQLIYTTGVKDPAAVIQFPNVIRLDNRQGGTQGRRYIVADADSTDSTDRSLISGIRVAHADRRWDGPAAAGDSAS